MENVDQNELLEERRRFEEEKRRFEEEKRRFEEEKRRADELTSKMTAFFQQKEGEIENRLAQQNELIKQSLESHTREASLRLDALLSMCENSQGKRNEERAVNDEWIETEKVDEQAEVLVRAESSKTKIRKRMDENPKFKTDVKFDIRPGQNKWKEGDDYIVWKRRVYLDMATHERLFLVKPGMKPDRSYTKNDLICLESGAMAYILSNIPYHYEKMLGNSETALEMMEELEKAITPPSHTAEFGEQIEFMNMVHDPAQETVVEFRNRVQEMVNRIRRCPRAELTESQIRRNVLMSIWGAYPRVVEKATENPDMTLKQIYEEMSMKRQSGTEALRRQSHAALLGGSTNDIPEKRLLKRNYGSGPGLSSHSKDNSVCFKCGFYGHWKSECRNPGKGCYICRRFNHIARHCPNRSRGSGSGLGPSQPKRFKKSGDGAAALSRTPAQERMSGPGCSRSIAQTNKMKSVVKRVDNAGREKRQKAKAKRKQAREEVAAIATRERCNDSDAISIGSSMSLDGKHRLLRFIADSGATEHIVNDISVFSELRDLEVPVKILCADKKAELIIRKVGDIIYYNTQIKKYGVLTEVLYAPGLLENLFSLRKNITRGLVAQFSPDTLDILDSRTGELVKRGFYTGRFWWLTFELPLLNMGSEKKERLVKSFKRRMGLAAFSEGTVEENSTDTSGDEGECTTKEVESKAQSSSTRGGGVRKRPRLESDTELGGSSTMETNAELGAERDQDSSSARKAVQSLRDNSGVKWHYRLNHASKKYLEIAGKVMPELKGIQFGSEILDCSDCKLAKAKRKPCSGRRHRSEQPFHRLHSDVVGPIKPAAFRSQARYIVTFTDDASRYAMAYEIADKTRVDRAMKLCLEEMRRLLGPETKVSELRVDGGLEYQTMEMKLLLNSEGIALTVAEPYTPQHNGTAERLNLELEEKIRVNLISSGLPTYLWPFTMRHVVHVHNRTPNSSNGFKSPYEVVFKRVPSITHIRRYGCEAYILDNKAKSRPKFAPRADLGFLLECCDTGYSLYHVNNRTVVRSKHVDFIESRTFHDYRKRDEILSEVVNAPFEFGEPVTEDASSRNVESEGPDEEEHTEKSGGVHTGEKRVEGNEEAGRKIGGDSHYDFYELDEEEANMVALMHSACAGGSADPVTYNQAVESPDAEKWREAINQEFKAIETCKTWKIVDRKEVPKGLKVMKTRWVHKRKPEVNGTTRYRSRLVVKGFADNHDYDLSEIYAPVARLPDVRFILIAAAKYNLALTQLDVKTAFLNGSLDKLVYIEIPEGYTEYLGADDQLRRTSVCEVHKALYGLKVSPRRWFVRFLEAVGKMQFTAYNFQPCLFIWKSGEKLAVMLLYVDDILLASNCPTKTAEVKSTLKREFSITDLGAPRKFLGMEIEREGNGEIRLHQAMHIQSMLDKFCSGEPKGYETPMLPDGDRSKNGNEMRSDWKREEIPYRQAIGTLLYLQNGTRPDISYAVNVLSRRQADFTEKHWQAVKRIMGYLAKTKDLALVFSPNSDSIDCYVDASLGMNTEDGHSTTGFVIYLFGCPVMWRTKKQNHIALSSAEAEFVAMSTACKELASLRTMCSEILGLKLVPTIHEDSKPAIRLAEVDDSSTLKHLVKLFYLYVREECKNGNVVIKWVGTNDQVADALTKPLSRAKFLRFRDRLLSRL